MFAPMVTSLDRASKSLSYRPFMSSVELNERMTRLTSSATTSCKRLTSVLFYSYSFYYLLHRVVMQRLSDYREQTRREIIWRGCHDKLQGVKTSMFVTAARVILNYRINDRWIHKTRCTDPSASYAAWRKLRNGSHFILLVLNTPHYPPRCALTTLSRGYLGCVIIRYSSWRAPVYCLLNFHSLVIIAFDFVASSC